jgi:hypothetical protein
MYTLSLERVWNLPVRSRRGDGAPQDTTLGAAVGVLLGVKVTGVSGWTSVDVKTEAEALSFEGPATARDWLRAFATLAQWGIHPASTEWYPFDCDHSQEDPRYAYSFFVVAQGRIVLDSVVLHKDEVFGTDLRRAAVRSFDPPAL